jgi:hypothetical protein
LRESPETRPLSIHAINSADQKNFDRVKDSGDPSWLLGDLNFLIKGEAKQFISKRRMCQDEFVRPGYRSSSQGKGRRWATRTTTGLCLAELRHPTAKFCEF